MTKSKQSQEDSSKKTQYKRLANIKKGNDINATTFNKKRKKYNKPHNQNNSNSRITTLEDKLKVYESIISDLTTKIKDYKSTIETFESKAKLEEELEVQENEVKPQLENTDNQKLKIEIEQLNRKNNSLTKEIEDWKNKCVRIAADLQNTQKQSEIDILQSKKQSKKNTIISIMDFLNTLNISFNYLPQTEDEKVLSYINTLKLSFEKVISELKVNGIEILKINPGDDFDAEYMNILNAVGNSDSIENKVIQVVGLGLKIDGQLVQPASVIIK
jgi:molecular chaperone GrpE